MQWTNLANIPPRSYTCGHCGNRVGAHTGWHVNTEPPENVSIHICPLCSKPSLFLFAKQYPGVSPGSAVSNLPTDVASLYDEARSALSAGAATAAVLACRKLLMNIAVTQGAATGLSFVAYVEYLATAGYIPPNGRGWVDHIRKRGNEATHEIALMSVSDAVELITFSEMLLKFIYEFPARVPAA